MSEVRRKTFEDILSDKPVSELPVVYRGTARDCINWCKQQPGFEVKHAKNQVYGLWFYNREESIALVIVG